MAFVDKRLRNRPTVEQKELIPFINRELVPVVNDVRAEVNRVSGDVVILSTTGDYNVQNTDRIIIAESGVAGSLYLPSAADMKHNYLMAKKANDSGSLLFSANGSETIDGSSTLVVGEGDYGWVEIFSDGENWHVIRWGDELFGTRLVTARATTSPYALTDVIDVLFCDTDTGAITVNLPAGVDGRTFRIINVGSSSNAVTITPDGSERVNSNATETLYDSESLLLTFQETEGWW